MIPLLPSVLEADEFVALDDSTAPTTPEGSLSFSPQLQPQDLSAHLVRDLRDNGASVSSDAFDVATEAPPVRNICCVGAGFVGTLTSHQRLRVQGLTVRRRTNCRRHRAPQPPYSSYRSRQGREAHPEMELTTPPDLRARPERHPAHYPGRVKRVCVYQRPDQS
jgi:hypothetical protein